MRFSSLFTLTLAAAPSFAAPFAPTAEEFEQLEKRASTFAITGATNGVSPRLEVRDLHNNPDAWNLFMLSMHSFFQTNQTAKLSYYQVAGIHGVPNIPWDGVAANSAASGAVGYCPHSSILFPTWHRIYTTLFEQIFLEQVQAVVNSWPAGATKNTYTTIAKTMRFPYFDWAAEPPNGLPAFPLIISTMMISVKTPTGAETIVNPLFRYDFNPLVPSDMEFNPWGEWTHTLRYPNSNSSATAYSQDNLDVAAFTNNRINIRNQLYSIFTQCTTYDEFSHDGATGSSAGCALSLEAVHDNIHSMLGGSNYGHMTYLWFAAFDPVFWLHHMNVDRLLAMWQTIYPNQWTISEKASGSTFTIAQGTTQGLNSPLTPFHKDTTGTFWTSSELQDWTKLGYTYPEFVDSSGSSADIMSYVNNLYGPTATATAGSSKAKRTDTPSLVERELPTNSPLPTASTVLLSTPNGERYDYTVNIAAQRFALGLSFSVYIFLGDDFDENPSSWAFDEQLIGAHGFFAMTGMKHHNVSVSGAVPLTQALTGAVSSGALPDMSIDNVVPYLQKNLQWRIATTNGVEVPPAQVPGLEISVVTANCTLSASIEEFPSWGDWINLPEVTNGQPGGLNIGETPAFEKARKEKIERFGSM